MGFTFPPDHSLIELLSPARDAECGIAAFSCGADAVYIGAERFSARSAASNPMTEIGRICRFGHRYFGRVYLALNILLTDAEIDDAVIIAESGMNEGVDAVILQDMGLFRVLKNRWPDLPVIASTQCFNADPEKVLMLEQAGFDRVILERQLSLEEIRAIRKTTRIGIETFVHGSLCWSVSGRCWMSFALGGRSGNRGECGQACRLPWTLEDREGRICGSRKHWMSLKDEDLSGRLEDLADAGVTSFKIEGRLRGPDYVRNVTAFYRKKLDEVLRNKRMKPSSSGKSDPGFDPDLAATFRRGGTILRLDGADRSVSAFSFGSPKSEGEPIGRVQSAESVWIDLGITISLRTGDGLCWTGPDGTDHGAFVNGVEGAKIRLSGKDRPLKGTLICRNKNAEFLKKLEAVKSVRNVMITVTVRTSADKVLILVEDEDGRSVSKELDRSEISEPKNEGQEKFWIRAFERTGGTIFRCSDVRFEGGPVRFYAVSRLNELRRFLLKEMELERERTRPRWKSSYRTDSSVRTEKWVKPEEGVLNRKAEAWYRNNGSPSVEWTYEAGTDIGSKALAVSRVCCFGDMGICGQGPVFYLRNDKGQRFRIETDCVDCGMRVFLDSKQG